MVKYLSSLFLVANPLFSYRITPFYIIAGRVYVVLICFALLTFNSMFLESLAFDTSIYIAIFEVEYPSIYQNICYTIFSCSVRNQEKKNKNSNLSNSKKWSLDTIFEKRERSRNR